MEETFGQGIDISDGDPKHKGADGQVSRYGEGNVIDVESFKGCGDVCMWSNIPIMAGSHNIPAGQKSVYFVVLIHRIEGVIAAGVHSPT